MEGVDDTMLRSVDAQLDDLVLLQDEGVLRSVEVGVHSGAVDDLEERRECGRGVNDAVDLPFL